MVWSFRGLQYCSGSGDESPSAGSRSAAPVWVLGTKFPEAEDVIRNDDIRMDSGERFDSFTIRSVTRRFAVTVRVCGRSTTEISKKTLLSYYYYAFAVREH